MRMRADSAGRVQRPGRSLASTASKRGGSGAISCSLLVSAEIAHAPASAAKPAAAPRRPAWALASQRQVARNAAAKKPTASGSTDTRDT